MQVQDKDMQVGAEQQAGLQPRRGGHLEAPSTARADAAVQRHLRHVRGDLGDVDAAVCLHRHLSHPGHVGLAVRAVLGQDVVPPRRVRVVLSDATRRVPVLGIGRCSRRSPYDPAAEAACWHCPAA
jgi:hypothetical protein